MNRRWMSVVVPLRGKWGQRQQQLLNEVIIRMLTKPYGAYMRGQLNVFGNRWYAYLQVVSHSEKLAWTVPWIGIWASELIQFSELWPISCPNPSNQLRARMGHSSWDQGPRWRKRGEWSPGRSVMALLWESLTRLSSCLHWDLSIGTAVTLVPRKDGRARLPYIKWVDKKPL